MLARPSRRRTSNDAAALPFRGARMLPSRAPIRWPTTANRIPWPLPARSVVGTDVTNRSAQNSWYRRLSSTGLRPTDQVREDPSANFRLRPTTCLSPIRREQICLASLNSCTRLPRAATQQLAPPSIHSWARTGHRSGRPESGSSGDGRRQSTRSLSPTFRMNSWCLAGAGIFGPGHGGSPRSRES